ncbi:MAG TPA: SMC family ATPase [Ktedonobacterales bacterium]
MHITRVELTNIKSYAHATIELRGGVTAIRGHNGAGKSTLLEAIGWALFDHLPYKPQKQFVREGENTGKVVVTFISPHDDREYQVTRRLGSSNDWAIYDPETGTRIDSHIDVVDFLRRHMRIEGSIKLEDLFASALGAPQGTLTADFLQTPANRKKIFDALLQVEDYGKAAEKLRATASYLKEQTARQDERIAALERESAQLEGWRLARDERREEQRRIALRLETLEADVERGEALLSRLREAQTELARREGVARVAEEAHMSAQRQLEQAARLLGESRAAAQTLTETRADHEAYQQAERERAAAQQRVQERDRLARERADAAQQHAHAVSDTRNATARLDEVAHAERSIVALQADVAHQFTLEAARDEAQRNVARLGDAQKSAQKLTAQRATLERAIAERERVAATIERERPLADMLDERRQRVETLQALAATRDQHLQRRAAIGRERAELAARREKASAAQARQQQNLRKLAEYRPLAERLGECEREQLAADQMAREIETRLQQNRRSRELSGAGQCPFLREPCKNIQQRGENNLRSYFDKLIAADEQALTPAQAQRAAATDQLNRARKAAEYYTRLDEYRAQLEQAEAQIADCDGAAQRLSDELEQITQALAAGDPSGLEEARRLLRDSQEADKRLATLPSVQQALAEQRVQLRDLSDELARHEATCAELTGSPDAQRAAEAELARLGDPRGVVAGHQAIASVRPQVEQQLAQATARRDKWEAELARLDESLAPYSNLTGEIEALDASILRTRPGHTRYLQHEQAAERLHERERDHAAAVERDTATSAAAQAATEALAEARANFDAQALADAVAHANELRSLRGQLRETQRHLAATLAELDTLIAHGEQVLADLERARVERVELGESQKTLDQFRDTIKEAGPLVTKRLLSQISVQANTIFGEIIGDRSAELAWEDEYEIVLRRGTTRRTFALLSGGEQMAAALATRLALLRRLTGLDLAFFDEPTQNMDSERRSALAEQIRRVRGFDQLIVISHDDTFEQGLDSVIHLEKRGGVTVVCDDDASFTAATPFTNGFEELRERLGADLSALVAE